MDVAWQFLLVSNSVSLLLGVVAGTCAERYLRRKRRIPDPQVRLIQMLAHMATSDTPLRGVNSDPTHEHRVYVSRN